MSPATCWEMLQQPPRSKISNLNVQAKISNHAMIVLKPGDFWLKRMACKCPKCNICNV